MVTSVAPEIYPLSTRDGAAIPLDVIQGLSTLVVAYSTLPKDISIPNNYSLCYARATTDCIITYDLAATIVIDSVEIPDSVFLPAETLLTVWLKSGAARILPLDTSGNLVIQSVKKWAGLGVSQQFSRL